MEEREGFELCIQQVVRCDKALKCSSKCENDSSQSLHQVNAPGKHTCSS